MWTQQLGDSTTTPTRWTDQQLITLSQNDVFDGQAAIDAIEAHIAILDRTGTIVATNRAWKAFAAQNGADLTKCGSGANYLDVCRSAGDALSAEILVGLDAILDGSRSRFTIEYPCDGPARRGWFVLTATAMPGESGGALISHLDVTAQHDAQIELDEANQTLRLTMDAAKLAVWDFDVEADTVTWIGGDRLATETNAPRAFANRWSDVLRAVHPDDRNWLRRVSDASCLDGAIDFEAEYRVETSDGGVRWLYDRGGTVELAADGRVRRRLGVTMDITEAKSLEARFRSLFDGAADAILISDQSGAYVDANSAATDLLGYSREELLSMHVGSLLPGNAAAELIENLKNAERLVLETEVIRKDGSAVRIEGRTSKVALPDGVVRVATLRNLTERTIADSALRASEARFRALVQNGGELIVVFDVSGALRYGSPAFQRTLGYPPQIYSDALPIEIIHPDDVAIVVSTWKTILERPERQRRLEYRIRRVDGEWVWLDGIMTNLVDDPAVGGIVLNARDITERKAMEAALAHERDLLNLLMDNLPDHVFFKDASSRFIRINRAGARSLGLVDPADAIGKTDADFGISPEDAAAFRAADLNVIETRRPIVDFVERMADSDQERWVSTTKVATFDERGVPSGIVGISRDVTARMQIEAALRASEAHKAAVLAAALDAVLTMDADGLITEFNPAAERILGYRRQDILGRSFETLLAHDAAASHPAALSDILKNGADSDHGRRLAVTAQRANGERFPAELVIAVVHTGRDDERPFFAGYLRDVTDAKRLEAELRHLALHDALTGLPNRTLFTDRLDQALKRSSRRDMRIAILFLDLDRFKTINDGLGHAAGDVVLKEAARRLQLVIRDGETLARFGGDEFVVLLEGFQHPADAERVAERLMTAMREPIEWNGKQISIGISVGVALAPLELSDPTVLMRAADTALYQAKSHGRGKIVVFTPGMADDAARRHALEADLRHAAARDELDLYIQPIISLESGEVVETEALLRWRHPTYGVVPAADFIEFAEGLGEIVTIGRWVMREACRKLAEWGETGPSIAVNLSVNQLREPGLVDEITCALAACHVDPKRLTVEITESVLIADVESATAILNALRGLGIRIAIDDFGTGYSSLSYLRDLPIDAIKLDRSFVRGLGSHAGSLAIVEAMISLAHALGLSVTAEGIESADQLALLLQVGCDRGQGYYIALPMPGGPQPPQVLLHDVVAST